MIVIQNEQQFLEMMQQVYNRGCEDMYNKMAGIKEEEENAPVTIMAIAEEYKRDRKNLLKKVKALRLITLSDHPKTIRRKDIPKLLAG